MAADLAALIAEARTNAGASTVNPIAANPLEVPGAQVQEPPAEEWQMDPPEPEQQNDFDAAMARSTPREPEARDNYDNILYHAQQRQRLYADDIPEETAAEAIRIGERFQVSPATVIDDLHNWRMTDKEVDGIPKVEPRLQHWLVTNEQGNIVVESDVGSYNTFEKAIKLAETYWHAKTIQDHLNDITNREKYDSLTPQDHINRREWGGMLHKTTTGHDDIPYLLKAPAQFADLAGLFNPSVQAAAGALGGNALNSMLNTNYAPQPLWKAVAPAYMQNLEANETWEMLADVKDANGNPLDDITRLQISETVGAASAAVEFLALGKLMKAMPGGAKLFKRDLLRKLLRNPGLAARMAGRTGEIATGIAAQPAQEVAQSVLKNVSVALTRANVTDSKTPLADTVIEAFTQPKIDAMLQEAKDVALLGVLPLAASPLSYTGVYKDYKKTVAQRDNLANVVGMMREESASARHPDIAGKVVEGVTKNQPSEFLAIPTAKFDATAKMLGVDPQDLALQITGSESAYLDATTANDAVVVTQRQFVEHLAHTDAADALLDHVRFEPDGMSLTERHEQHDAAMAANREAVAEEEARIEAEESAIPEVGEPSFDNAAFDAYEQQVRSTDESAMTPGQKYQAYLELAHSGAVGTSANAHARAWIALPQEARDFSNTPDGTETARQVYNKHYESVKDTALLPKLYDFDGADRSVVENLEGQRVVHAAGTDAQKKLEQEVILDPREDAATGTPVAKGKGKASPAKKKTARSLNPVPASATWENYVEGVGRLARAREELTGEATAAAEAVENAIDVANLDESVPMLDQYGMTEEEAAERQKLIGETKNSGAKYLTKKAIRALHERRKAVWQKVYDKVLRGVKKDLNFDDKFMARSILLDGETAAGEKIEKMHRIKLDTAELKELYGERILEDLPTRGILKVHRVGGESLSAVSAMFNMTPTQLVDALTSTPDHRQYAKDVADKRTRAYAGTPISIEQTQLEVEAALANDAKSRLIQLEARILSRKLDGRRVPSTAQAGLAARRTVAALPVRALKPAMYRAAETRHRQAALIAMEAGDLVAAIDAKVAELYANEHARAADAALTDARDILGDLGKWKQTKGNKVRKRTARALGNHMEQIDHILEKLGVRHRTKDQVDATMDMGEYRELFHKEHGLDLIVEQSVMDLDVSMPTDATVQQLFDAADAINRIEHMAKQTTRDILDIRRQARIEKSINVANSIYENGTRARPSRDSTVTVLPKSLRSLKDYAVANHTKMEFLFEEMDGFKSNGYVWQTLFQPMAKAEELKQRSMEDITAQLDKIFSAYTKKELKRLHGKVFYDEALGEKVTLGNLLVLAMNQGNQYNKENVLKRGTKKKVEKVWTQQQVDESLKRLSKKDWQVVQKILDLINDQWGETAALHRRVTGTIPEKVESVPIKTQYGTLRGGYFPVSFDLEQSIPFTHLARDADSVQKVTHGEGGAFAMTGQNHTKKRAGTHGRAFNLDLNVVGTHLEYVVHDLTHREAVIDVLNVIKDPHVEQAVMDTYGNGMNTAMDGWINDIAGDRRYDPTNTVTRIAGAARNGATIVYLGWKVSTALLQTSGLLFGAGEIGASYMLRGFRDAFSKEGSYGFVTKRSTFMKNRISGGYDRDTRDFMRRNGIITGKQKGLRVPGMSAAMSDSFIQFIGMAQMVADLPTWNGAYRKAMDGAVENVGQFDEEAAIAYADRTVRITQGSGSAKDLVGAQRGHPMVKMFTTFYTFGSTLYNIMAKNRGRLRSGDLSKTEFMSTLMWNILLPAAYEATLRGRLNDPDGEPEDLPTLKSAGKAIAVEAFKYPLQSILFVRDIADAVQYGDASNPTVDAINYVSKLIGLPVAYIKHALDDDEPEPSKGMYRGAAYGVGVIFKLPVAQAWTMGETMVDLFTGEYDPGRPTSLAYNLFVRKDR